MTDITNEQADLLRKRRAELYDLYRKALALASDLDVPECPHQSLEYDLEASKYCEYCRMLGPLHSAVRELEDATVMLDKALLNGPNPNT